MACALNDLNFDITKSIQCFDYYLQKQNLKISRAEFEENLYHKLKITSFREDIQPLLSNANFNDESFLMHFNIVLKDIIQQLPGEPWKGIVENQKACDVVI